MNDKEITATSRFRSEVEQNQARLTSNLQATYDYIVCGAGASGSVVARRLAEDLSCTVLLIEAGDGDADENVTNPNRWFLNLGTKRDWGFVSEPNRGLRGRSMPLSMGKGLGGGSSINAMIWSRGHREDWEFFAAEAGDPVWNYSSVLDIYRRIEDWQGEPDVLRRGVGGLVYVENPAFPNPLAPAMVQAAHAQGIPSYQDQNGSMMEGDGGAALTNLRIRDGKRQSTFNSYVHPIMAQPNLTVLTGALVLRVNVEKSHVQGVDLLIEGAVRRVRAARETVLSLGAIHTPKVLMQSGIGDAAHLRAHGIHCVQNLPGVGQNFQDHVFVAGCIWEYKDPLPLRNNAGEATLFWKSESSLEAPDLQPNLAEIPLTTPITAGYLPPEVAAWTIVPGLVRPHSRGRVLLSGPEHSDPLRIEANALGEESDLLALRKCLHLVRELGNSAEMAPYRKREIMPGSLKGEALDRFIQDGLNTYWHQSCTAKMGRDEMSVVDARLSVHGLTGIRIADASVMPRVTTGNTQAPCVVIGEQVSRFLRDMA